MAKAVVKHERQQNKAIRLPETHWKTDKHVTSTHKLFDCVALKRFQQLQTDTFCSSIDRSISSRSMTNVLLQAQRAVSNCIPTPFLTFLPWPAERYGCLPDHSSLSRACVSACAYMLHEGAGHQTSVLYARVFADCSCLKCVHTCMHAHACIHVCAFVCLCVHVCPASVCACIIRHTNV